MHHSFETMKNALKNILLALNYGVTVAICLLLRRYRCDMSSIISQQIAIFEKALIGFGAIAFGMLIRRIINWVSPVKQVGITSY